MEKRRKKPENDNVTASNMEKWERKALLEQEKRKKPGECLKFIKVIIDTNIVNEDFGSRVLTNLNNLGVRYEVKNNLLSNVIYWQRSIQQTFLNANNMAQLSDKYEDEEQIIYIMTGSELNETIKGDKLRLLIKNIQQLFNRKQITLLVHGLKEFCRTNRNNVGRLAIETALTEIQLEENVSHRLLDTAEDVGYTVMQYSKSIAEIPFKRDRTDKNAEQNFYIVNDNKDCVQVKGEIGLTNLWQRHLIKFPLVTLETAEAIIGEYSMPSKLIKAYESRDINGPLLLADIPVRRAAGILTAVRKVGAELSKKVHTFYTNTDPEYIL